MGNTRKRIKRSKRVKMRKANHTRKAKNTRKANHTRKAKHTRKLLKKKTKQSGRGSPPGFPPLPRGNNCRYKRSDIPGSREYRNQVDCNKIYGCEWGEKFSALHPMRDAKPRCHKSMICDYGDYRVPCYLLKKGNKRHTYLIDELIQQNLKRTV